MANIPQITEKQMEFMKSRKEKETVVVNGISAEIQPYMFPPISPYSYSTRVLLNNMSFTKGEKVLEIGTGCGILSVFAAKQGARVDGVDILPECIEYSLRNAIKNKVFERTRFYYSNMFSNVEGKYEAIICNLPILNETLPDNNPAWYSLFDPGFKFHSQLFKEGQRFAPKIIIAHANLRSNSDFMQLEEIADKSGWKKNIEKSQDYADKTWRCYEFKYTGINIK